MGLKTLVVDDEPIARRVLREELELIDGVELIGEAEDGPQALEAIERTRPDLVLLDLQMPGMGGLDVVRGLGSHVPAIVVVTAHDAHAVEALEAGAVDYLLKPVRQARLEQAVDRARRLSGALAFERAAKLQEMGAKGVRKIVGRAGSEYFLLSADEILAFQAEGELVWIITARKKYLATHTLKALAERLKDSGFCRIHRGAVVNVEHVRKMSALTSQRWLLTLSNGQEFIVSKRQASTVRDLLRP